MQNLEAKFKLSDLDRARKRAESIGFQLKGTFRQRDTFFRVPNGKLKMREEESACTLIYYQRGNSGSLKLSDYEIIELPDPQRMRLVLTASLGVLAEVRKERTLLQKGNMRLHLDVVDGLGSFGEIEAVLSQEDDPAPSRKAVEDLITMLDVRRQSLISASYFEMLRPV